VCRHGIRITREPVENGSVFSERMTAQQRRTRL
jgi:hypothetical protein